VLRVSSDAQDVARQRSAIKRLRMTYSGSPIETLELIDVKGTEAHLNPDVLRVISKIADPACDGIAASAIDRLLRVEDLGSAALFDAFKKHRKLIWTESDGLIDITTKEGFAKLWNALGQSGIDWRTICERTRGGMAEKRERGELPYFVVPYGFRRERKRRKVEGVWRVYYELTHHPLDEPKREVVRRIFKLSAQGMNDNAIAFLLNDEGEPSPAGSKWSRKTVGSVLGQSAYIGDFVWAGKKMGLVTHFACEPVLLGDDARLYAIAQTRAERNKQQVGAPTRNHQLQKLVWCKLCGRRMCGRRQSRAYRYYKCMRLDKGRRHRICASPQIKGEWLEDSAWNDLCDHYGDAGTLQTALNDYHTQLAGRRAPRAPKANLDKLRARLEQIEENLDDPTQQYRRATLVQSQTKLLADIAKAEQEAHDEDVIEMPTRQTLAALAEAWRIARSWKTFSERRVFWLAFVKRIDYYAGEYEMTLNVPTKASDINTLNTVQNGNARQVLFPHSVPLKLRGTVTVPERYRRAA
jgi:DNA invertase Pin-like site-specific DNA recombinase